ncbi:unnamed protein product [Didymodactylos carnosus]|uniref:Uncharacterized protein n=1 Tax=Didymodactylos carnosus TaxID=1234261 RepID=A0A814N9C0_9BILA|nr:unnamed protein product [Didymodactylos carnosus]CAF1181403.1 unnamed protein product [Didymodactylos carnosus]CAF3855796.1 unnamed protein product [Didymodactylos carnosus]CAF3992633.1 unnamed protein product [Didymodactylos carnosus]
MLCITLELATCRPGRDSGEDDHRRPPIRGRPDQVHHGDFGGDSNWDLEQVVRYICRWEAANSTNSQTLLNVIVQYLTRLQSNGTYQPLLSKYNQTVAYVQNATNQALFLSNCTQFFQGLKGAFTQDKQRQEQIEQLASSVKLQVMQLLIDTFNGIIQPSPSSVTPTSPGSSQLMTTAAVVG